MALSSENTSRVENKRRLFREKPKKGKNMSTKPIIYFVRPKNIISFDDTYWSMASDGISLIVMAGRMGEFNLQCRRDTKIIKSKLKEYNLCARACHGLLGERFDLNCPEKDFFDEMLESHQKMLVNAADLGCRTYTVHSGARNAKYGNDFLWGQVRKSLDVLVPAAGKNGIVIGLENANPGHFGDNVAELVGIVEEYSHSHLKLCFDSGHAHRSATVGEVFDIMAPHLVTCHLHDNDKSEDQHRIPGFGTIDWLELVAKIKSCQSLLHIETEAFNLEGWPHRKLFEHYQQLLK